MSEKQEKDKEAHKNALKITTQFRAKRAMVYELRGNGANLSLSVSPRESASDAGEWRIEAAAVHGPSTVSIVEWGPTRAETLREIGQTWGLEASSRGLPTFDWDEVARLLSTVMAI